MLNWYTGPCEEQSPLETFPGSFSVRKVSIGRKWQMPDNMHNNALKCWNEKGEIHHSLTHCCKGNFIKVEV